MSAGADAARRTFVNLTPGDPAPWFLQRSTSNPRYAFQTAAGRYVVLCFFSSAADSLGRCAIDAALANRSLFDDARACFFGVSIDRRDEKEQRVRDSMPGIRFFWDFDGKISRLYGAIPKDAEGQAGPVPMRRFWLLLDPMLRVMAVFPFAADGCDHAALFSQLAKLPPPERFAGFEVPAPVLILPNVFEPALCRTLIDRYEAHGGQESELHASLLRSD